MTRRSTSTPEGVKFWVSLAADIVVIVAVVLGILWVMNLRGNDRVINISDDDITAGTNLSTGEVIVTGNETSVSYRLVNEVYDQLEQAGQPGKWQSLADDTGVSVATAKQAVAWEIANGQESLIVTAPAAIAIWNTWPDKSTDAETHGYYRFADTLEAGTVYMQWTRGNPYLLPNVDYWVPGWGIKAKCLNSITPRVGVPGTPVKDIPPPPDEDESKLPMYSGPLQTPHDPDNPYTQDDPAYDVKVEIKGYEDGNAEAVEAVRGIGEGTTGTGGTGAGGVTPGGPPPAGIPVDGTSGTGTEPATELDPNNLGND